MIRTAQQRPFEHDELNAAIALSEEDDFIAPSLLTDARTWVFNPVEVSSNPRRKAPRNPVGVEPVDWKQADVETMILISGTN